MDSMPGNTGDWKEKASEHIIKKIHNHYFQEWNCFYHGGEGSVKCYTLWPGLYLFENDFYMNEFPSEITSDYHLMKINFCVKGRCEVKLQNNQYVYLEPNFLNIDSNQEGAMFHFPGGRYLGMELILNPEELCRDGSPVFREFGVDFGKQYQELQSIGGTRIGIPSRQCIARMEHIRNMSEQELPSLYELRLTVLEFLYHLFQSEYQILDTKVSYLTREQREIALSIERELMDSEEPGKTIFGLAEKYGSSCSSLENYFRAVFGESIYQYQKKQKLRRAKRLLADYPGRKIKEIAHDCGYQHPGKFSESFRRETGMSPGEYRRYRCREFGR